MFGLVLRSSLLECEKRRVALKVARMRLAREVEDLSARCEFLKLELERSEAEKERLLRALFAKAGERAVDGPEAPAPTPPAPRMLTGYEVVTRATAARNRHQAAAQKPAVPSGEAR